MGHLIKVDIIILALSTKRYTKSWSEYPVPLKDACINQNQNQNRNPITPKPVKQKQKTPIEKSPRHAVPQPSLLKSTN